MDITFLDKVIGWLVDTLLLYYTVMDITFLDRVIGLLLDTLLLIVLHSDGHYFP